MSVRVLQGDCREVLGTLQDQSIDCIITDPPYGETSLTGDIWQEGWLPEARRVLKPSGSMWVFGSQRMFLEHISDFAGWRFVQDVIWEKHNGTGLFNDRFRRVHEIALQFVRADSKWTDIYKLAQVTNDARARTVRKKGRPAQWIGATGETIYKSEDGGPRLMRSVIFERSEHGRAEHPTQKPIGIVEPLALYSCPPGGTILDPFAGSGTTGLVARRHGFDAILVEARDDYIRVIENRLANDAPLFSHAAS